jgi:hypothetical protein
MKTQTESKEYSAYLKNYLKYPDYTIYKRLSEMPKEENLLLSNLEEVKILDDFAKYLDYYKVKPGSFYKVRYINYK